MPIAKAAKSTAFPPLIIEVEAALLHGTAGGALFLQKIGVYYISSFRTLGYTYIITQVINHKHGNSMLGQARPNSITQVMIYNLSYDL